ncbi:MAG: NADH-quinone oxidoreductase subunit A [Actinobacteria bacterium]|nr:NADH-quinone oxidoreductase subunit A [Actinomycetota bacterium]
MAGDAMNPPMLTGPERVPFAGGHQPVVHAWARFHFRYYAMALLFLAFDMEMVFMYPWAVVFVREGITALVEMLMFITILVLGILYTWRERALEWA